MDGKELAKITAEALFYASLQSSIGSVEMSSKFSVLNFSKDQETLQRAADALRSYIIIGLVWTLGTALALYAVHGWCGIWIGIATNMMMMGWIVISYMKAFKEAAEKNGLKMPTLLQEGDRRWGLVVGSSILLGALYLYQ